MNGHELRALRERLDVCVEAVAEAVGLRSETIEYVEYYGYDWEWAVTPAAVYLAQVERDRAMQPQPAPQKWCIALGEPFRAHCADCLSGAAAP